MLDTQISGIQMSYSCRICTQTTARTTRIPGYVEGEDFDVFFCQRCGASSAVVPPDYDYNGLYDMIYKNPSLVPGYQRYLKYAQDAMAERDALAFLADAEPQYSALQIAVLDVPKSAAILEIGSGLGYSTYALRSSGYAKAIGCDLSQKAVHASSARYGPYFFTEEQLPQAQYDFIFATEVIEHVSDPTAFLRQQIARLKPNGRLLITTPRTRVRPGELPTATTLWVSDPPPVHLWCLSLQSLQIAGEKAGASAVMEVQIPLRRSLLQRKVIASEGKSVFRPHTGEVAGNHPERQRWKQAILDVMKPITEDIRLLNWMLLSLIGKGKAYTMLPSGKTEVLAVLMWR